jgi:hypothetical protein
MGLPERLPDDFQKNGASHLEVTSKRPDKSDGSKPDSNGLSAALSLPGPLSSIDIDSRRRQNVDQDPTQPESRDESREEGGRDESAPLGKAALGTFDGSRSQRT